MDDDGTPSFSILPKDAWKEEGNSGTTLFTFNVVRSGDSDIAVSVGYEVQGFGGADEQDFGGAFPSDTVTFSNSQDYLREVTIGVACDTDNEPNEDFPVVLVNSSPTATLDIANQFGLIENYDNDFGFTITSLDASQDEGNDGDVKEFTFEVKRNGNLDVTATVDISVTGSGSNPADWMDYAGSTVSTIPFAIDQDTQTLIIKVKGDNTPEPDEEFTVNLSNPTGTTNIVNDHALGTIIDDDNIKVSIVALDASKCEGDAGGNPFKSLITWNRPLGGGGNVTVSWSVQGAGATADDFSAGAFPSGSWLFPATQQTTQTHEVVVFVKGDTTPELDEGFIVKLDQPPNVNLGNSQALGTIIDDDTTIYTISSSVSRGEGTDITPVLSGKVVFSTGSYSRLRRQAGHWLRALGRATVNGFGLKERPSANAFLPS